MQVLLKFNLIGKPINESLFPIMLMSLLPLLFTLKCTFERAVNIHFSDVSLQYVYRMSPTDKYVLLPKMDTCAYVLFLVFNPFQPDLIE